jgi:hypothetical protein
MKFLFPFLFFLASVLSGWAAQPNPAQVVSGSLATTTTGVICTMTNQYATSYTVILDALSGGTGVGTAVIQTLSTSGGTYQTTTAGITGNPFSLTATSFVLVTIPGPLLGIQVNLTAHGTSGTIVATIIAN